MTDKSLPALQSDTSDLSVERKKIVEESLSASIGMPKFKARNFVGHAQITPYAAMKQFLLEINSREAGLIDSEYQREKAQIEVDRLTHRLEKVTDEFDRREIELEIKHINAKIVGWDRKLRDLKQERIQYIELIEELNATETVGDKTLLEAVQDPEMREELERDYWIKRLGKQAAMDMVAYGRVGVGNIDSITMLDQDDQRKTLQLASDVLVWHENRMQHILSNSNEAYQLENRKSELAEQLKLTKD